MSHPVITLNLRESVGRIMDTLQAEYHEGYPVVEGYDHDHVSMQCKF